MSPAGRNPHRAYSFTTQRTIVIASCLGAALLLYFLSAAPGVVWQDSGTHQWRIITGRLENTLGLVLSHPLHFWLGRGLVATGLGEPAHLLNLLSGFWGAIGVGGLSWVVFSLVRNVGVTLLAAATLAFSFIYWQMSSVTETYTLAAALMTIEWALLLQYSRRGAPGWLVALFFVNGLHCANHLLGLLTLAPYGVLLLILVWRGRVKVEWVLAAGLVWVIAAAPYWGLCVQYYLRTGDLVATLQSAFFGGNRTDAGFRAEVLNASLNKRQLMMLCMNLGYNFPSLAIPIAVFGMFRRPASPSLQMVRRVLLAQTILIFVFVARYSIVDIPTFFVPVNVTVALWFAIGVDALWQARHSFWARPLGRTLLQATPVVAVACYAIFPVVAESQGWLRSQLRHIPFRNEYKHFFQPWKFDDDSAERFCTAVFEQMTPGDWVLTDGTPGYPLAYYRLAHPKAAPESIRVYAWNECLTDPSFPFPTSADMLEHLQRRGSALVVPDGTKFYDDRFGKDFEIDKHSEFWHIERR